MYYTFTGLVLFIGFAMMVREGLWNNLVNLVAIVLAGLAAFGLHQPLVVMADEASGGSLTYLLDFPILWFTFAIVVGLLRQVANLVSKHRVAFPEGVDNGAGAGVGFLAAYALAAFAMATFHAAPLGRDMMGGAMDYGDTVKETASGLADASGLTRPDVAWLRLCDAALSPTRLGRTPTGDSPIPLEGFSSAVFVQQHALHRGAYGKVDGATVKR